MKEFRGALIAFILLLLIGGGYWLTRPDVDSSDGKARVQLFSFEKHELQRVSIQRPGQKSLVLQEVDDQWKIEGTDLVAGRTMINRIKHQLHDLTARAKVTEQADKPELYGLGKNAIKVELVFRNKDKLVFLAGDPNPTAVSYYIQPLPGKVVYTVKKSALDYYSLDFDSFREPRFVAIHSKDVQSFRVDLHKQKKTWSFERIAEKRWKMLEPRSMFADEDRISRMLGRIVALKSQRFIDPDDKGTQDYGFQQPTLTIDLKMSDGKAIKLLMGNTMSVPEKRETTAYFKIDGQSTIYVARDSLVDEFTLSVDSLKNRKVLNLSWDEIQAIDVALQADKTHSLNGDAGVRFRADQWLWLDGVPVPGSTPKRLAQALGTLSVVDFISDKSVEDLGMMQPKAKIKIKKQGDEITVLIGGGGPPAVGEQGRTYPRRYMKLEGETEAYLIDEHVLKVAQDMVREYQRKAKADEEKAQRQERIRANPDGK